MRWSWPADLLPATLDAIAEGSLVWVVYLAFAVSGRGGAHLGPIEFAIAAALGLGLARRSVSGHWPRPGIYVLAVLAGIAGWLGDPAVRSTVASVGPALALGHHVPGWLLGIAVLRGAVHREPADDDRVTGVLLAAGTPVLAVPWLLHAGSSDTAFAAPTLVGSLLFVTSSLLAIGFGRLRALGIAPHESAGGRTWIWLTAGVTLVVGVTAVGGALVLGAPMQALLAAAVGPIAGVLAVAGVVLSPVAAPIWSAVSRLLAALPAGLPVAGGAGTSVALPAPSPGVPGTGGPSPVVLALVLLAMLVAGGLLVRYRRLFTSPKPWKPERGAEEHTFVRPHVSLSLRLPAVRPHLWRPVHRAATDAAAAYLQVLAEMEHDPDLRRHPAESPSLHARRIRGRGLPDAALGLLAADFELARYGDRPLSRSETLRGLSRARRLHEEMRRFLSRGRRG
jgi:hypothetical protein